MFKSQYHESLLLPHSPTTLSIQDCTFNKGCQNDPTKSMINLSGSHSSLNIANTLFKKSQGSALNIQYEENFTLNVQNSQFTQNKGDYAISLTSNGSQNSHIAINQCEILENLKNGLKVQVMAGADIKLSECLIQGNKQSGIKVCGEKYLEDEIEYRGCKCSEESGERKKGKGEAKIEISKC
jgi:transcriptional regulator